GGGLGFVSRGFAVFGAFDQVAVGITLTLATIAATTLTTGAAARTFTVVAVLLVILQLLFVRQRFVLQRLGLLGTRLALFARRTLALLTLATGLALGALFALFIAGSIQRLAQLAHAFFTWGALFAWLALTAIFLTFARGTFFTRLTLFTRLALLARFTTLALFTRGTLFAG